MLSPLNAKDSLDEKSDINLNADMHLKIYPNTLATEAFFMRPLFPTDASPSLLKTYANPKAMRYYGPGITFFEGAVKSHFKDKAYQNLMGPCESWAVINYDGIVGKTDAFQADFPDEEKTELSICIAQEYSNRGFATKALGLLINHLKGPFIATVHPKNYASQKVLNKLDFKVDPKRQNMCKYNQLRDYYVRDREKVFKGRARKINFTDNPSLGGAIAKILGEKSGKLHRLRTWR